jgi:hypothetical protein
MIELSEFYWTAILKNSAEAVSHYARPTVVLLTLTFLLWSISLAAHNYNLCQG